MIFTGENNLQKVAASGTVSWDFQISSGANKARLTFSVVAGPDAENAPEWTVNLYDATKSEIWSNDTSKTEITVDLLSKNAKNLRLEVICPDGARYGDSVTTTVTGEADDGVGSMVFEAVAQQSIMVLKTQIDQEKSVADTLNAKAHLGEKDIYAILSPQGLRGYVFVEGMNTERLLEKTREIKKARKFIEGETSIEDIEPYLTPASPVIGISEGESYIASDVPAILQYTRSVYYIDNLEIARIKAGEVSFFNLDGDEVLNLSDGGFICEQNMRMDEAFNFTTKKGLQISLKNPDEVSKDIQNRVQSVIQEVEDAIFSENFKDEDEGYKKYLDVDSFVEIGRAHV